MKRIFVFIIVGLLMFGVGFGGGLMFGRQMAADTGAPGGGAAPSIPEPGPIVPLGQFTTNLAGTGRNIIDFSVSLEAANLKAVELLSARLAQTRDRIFLIVKDKIYEDLTSAEGALQLKEEIKRVLNSQLPPVDGEPPVANILFDSFVLQ